MNLIVEETPIQRSRLALLGLIGSSLLLAACGRAPAPMMVASRAVGLPQGLSESAAPVVIPAALRDKVTAAQHLIGKPLAFKTADELEAYLGSVALALPQTAYDPDGFLAKLGVADARTPGREDAPTLDVVRKLKGYRPGTLVNGREILPQVFAFDLAMAYPHFFLSLINATNPSVEAMSLKRAGWKAPFVEQKAVATQKPAPQP